MAEVGDRYSLKLVTQMGNQLGLCVLHATVLVKSGTGATETGIASGWASLLSGPLRDLMSAASSYRGLISQKEAPLPASPPTISTFNQGAGNVASDILPKATAGVLTLRTSFAGRRYRGRMFIPWPGESDNDANGFPTGAYNTRLAALGAVISATQTVGTAPNTNDMRVVVYSRKFGLVTNVTLTTSGNKWGIQHRRGDFGAANVIPF